MSKDEEIEYEDKKVKRFLIGGGFEFYLIDDYIETTTEAEASITKLGGRGKRVKKTEYHALIVKDPEFGHMPYNAWEEKARHTVMGTISPHMDSPVDSGDIFVTASTALRKPVRNCTHCYKMIPTDSKFCPECGVFLNW